MKNFKKTILLLAILFSSGLSSGQVCENPDNFLTSSYGETSDEINQLYACPRCRRATPPGPRKRPADPAPAAIV